MTVKEIAEKTGAHICAGAGGEDREVKGCYIGDMLSLAIGGCSEKNVWITMQTNVNVTAVAVLNGASCIAVCSGRTPDAAMLERAQSENIPVLCTKMPAYELAIKLHAAGI